jgi:type I restriction enzyme S subunit
LNKVAIPDFEGKCSTELVPLLPSAALDRIYLAYFLRSPPIVSQISAKTAGARMPRADMDFVLGLDMPLPSLDEQRRFVDLLSRAEGIVRLRREAQKKAAEIIPALFVDMFGDPAQNAKGWETRRLGDIAEVVSGITKGRKLNGKATVPVPYLRVANVQAGYLNLAEMKEIEATSAEIDTLKLRAGDIVLTEGGDFDKLGRGTQWRGEVFPCIHQNHVFRVRLGGEYAKPDYFDAYLQTRAAARYFQSVAKRTTNLASINMSQLRNLPVMLPPIQAQSVFASHASAARSIQLAQQTATRAAIATLNGLLSSVLSDLNY